MSNQFRPSGYQQRWRVDHIAVMTPYVAGPGVYGGFYDITMPGGAESLTAVPAQQHGNPIYKLTQLIPGATATDITYTSSLDNLPAEIQVYRKPIVYSNGKTYPRVPLMFYPENYFDAFVDGPSLSTMALAQPAGDVGVVGFVPGFTTILVGAKMFHELSTFLQQFAAFFGQGLENFPVPETPGTLIITTDRNPATSLARQTTYVNGSLISVQDAPDGSPIIPVDGFDNAAVNQIFGILLYPCWGFQKMSVFTGNVNAAQVREIHAALAANIDNEHF